MASSRVKLLLKAIEPYGAEKIYLFGSRARGEADALSDIDLVLIKRTRARFFQPTARGAAAAAARYRSGGCVGLHPR